MIKMTKSWTIPISWYNDIKDVIPFVDVYIYTDEYTSYHEKEMAEIDFDEIDEETLIWHSRELGWME